MPGAQFRCLALVTLVSAAGGCADSVGVTFPDTSGIDLSVVTGDAALALDANGYFALSNASAWQRSEITETQAAAMADVFIAKHAFGMLGHLEQGHQSSIDLKALTRCGRAFYAATPYAEPPSDYPSGIVNIGAARWLFSFCKPSGQGAVSVAVATTATLTIQNGAFDPASFSGSEFHAEGIPSGISTPTLPERAVERLARESGKRVALVPKLILPGIGHFPQGARWELGLEAAARVLTLQGSEVDESILHIGRGQTDWTVVIARAVSDPAKQTDEVTLPTGESYQFNRRLGIPTGYEVVQVRKPQ